MKSSAEPLCLSSAHVAEEMAPFTMPSAFKMVNCMTTENTTPPPSPKGISTSSGKSPTAMRLRLARLVTKYPEPTKTTKKLRRSRSLRQQEAASTGYGTRHRPVVSQIKTPYPFMIESPVSIDDSDKQSCQLPQLELRRVSSSYQNLRAAAQVQDQLLTLPSRSHPQTPLLPSPVIDDRATRNKPVPQSYFMIKQETPFAIKRKDRTYKSYEDLHILSCYDDQYTISREDLNHDDAAMEVTSLEGDETSPNVNSFSASPISPQNSIVSSNSSISSPESGWLANTTSHNERQQRFKARCYQVVQHSHQCEEPVQEPDDKIMLATVLVGRRKPKIVQIQRPPSSNNSVRSKGSVATRRNPPIVEMPAPPSTPVHQINEISAFSPYDTPSNFTPFSDLSQSACTGVKPKLHEPIYSNSKLDLIPMPLSTSRNTSSIPDCSVMSDGDSQAQTDADPFEMLDEDVRNVHPWLTRSLTNSMTWMGNGSRRSTVQPSPTENIATQTMYRKLDRSVSLITKAIDAFPNVMIRLDSAAVLGLRSYPTPQADQRLIDALKVIFPNTPKQLLSTLAAWVIVDSYFSNLEKYRPESITSINRTFSTRIFPVPSSKRIAPNTIATTKSLSTDPFSAQRPPFRANTFPLPTPFDESLHSIPSKARTVLGIDPDINARLLLTQAKALRLSISVVAQRLLEIIRRGNNNDSTSESWDPTLWCALGVTVQLIENSASEEHQFSSRARAGVGGDKEAGEGDKGRCRDRSGSRDTVPTTATATLPTMAMTNSHEEQARPPIRNASDVEERLGSGNDYLPGTRDVQTWV